MGKSTKSAGQKRPKTTAGGSQPSTTPVMPNFGMMPQMVMMPQMQMHPQMQGHPQMMQGQSQMHGHPLMMQGHPQMMQGQLPMQGHMMQGQLPMQGHSQMTQGQLLSQQMQLPHQPPAENAGPELEDTDEDENSYDSDDDKRGSYSKGPKALISRGGSVLASLPRVRLAEMVQAVSPMFDSGMTSDYESTTLVTLLWTLTRIKPQTRIADLRVTRYNRLAELLQTANRRLRQNMTISKYEDQIEARLGHHPTAETIAGIADTLGFQQSWLAPPTKGKGKGKGGVQTALPDLIRMSAAAVPPVNGNSGSSGQAQPCVVPLVCAPLPRPHSPVIAVEAVVAPVPDLVPPQASTSDANAAVAALMLQLSRLGPDALKTLVASMGQQGQQQHGQRQEGGGQALQISEQQPPAAMPPAAPASSYTSSAHSALLPQQQWEVVSHQPPPQQEQQPLPQQPLDDQGVQQQDVEQVFQQPAPQLDIQQQVESEVPQAADGGLMCAFCQQKFGEMPVESLLCGHVFHTACVDDYLSATGKQRDTCHCPFKCRIQEFVVIAEQDPTETAEAVAEAPPADDAMLQLAELAQESAQADIS